MLPRLERLSRISARVPVVGRTQETISRDNAKPPMQCSPSPYGDGLSRSKLVGKEIRSHVRVLSSVVSPGERCALQAGCELRRFAFGYTIGMYIKGGLMRVSKWGNSLAIRLPTAVVDALDLKEGDQIEIRIARERVFEVSRDHSKPDALARLRKLRRPLPPGFVFDREEANAR
jgi:antitoxin MazE